MARTTIITSSGKTVTGTEVRREGNELSLGRVLAAVATLGVSEALAPDTTRVTVKDSNDRYWTRKPQ